MKQLSILLGIVLVFTHCQKTGPTRGVRPAECVEKNQLNKSIVPSDEISTIMEEYIIKGLPGISFIARKGNQYWQENKGLANRSKNEAMESCMVWPGFSITKMYTATTILKLKEEGKIQLDQTINACLPTAIVAQIPDAEKISVRMLLNHSSGIENFWDNEDYILSYLENPFRTYSIADYLRAGSQRLFEPGKDASYSNTNYLILALIADHVTGESHRKAFEKYIINPLGLTATYYQHLPANKSLKTPLLYADLEGEGELTDYTPQSFVQFKNEIGSNSMMATPKDFVDFLFALTHQKLVSGASFTEMKTWFTGSDPTEKYGLGLENFDYNGKELYGHSGSSFGGRTILLYIPEKDLCLFIGINASAELGGPVLTTVAEFMLEIAGVLTR